jgi:hypothetical protein
MDASVIPLSIMFLLSLFCVIRTEVVVSYLMRQSKDPIHSSATMPNERSLKKQLEFITYYGGWFVMVLTVVLGLLYFFGS